MMNATLPAQRKPIYVPHAATRSKATETAVPRLPPELALLAASTALRSLPWNNTPASTLVAAPLLPPLSPTLRAREAFVHVAWTGEAPREKSAGELAHSVATVLGGFKWE